MNTLRLAAIAVQAERVRLRHTLRRAVAMALLLAMALGLVLMAVAIGHVALYHLLAARMPPAGALGTLAGGDMAAAGLIALAALNSSPGEAEREAAELSLDAQNQIRASFSWLRILMAVVQSVRRR